MLLIFVFGHDPKLEHERFVNQAPNFVVKKVSL